MVKFNSLSIVTISKTNFSYLRVLDGIIPFFEKPSDEFDKAADDCGERVTAIDLFSHFTADIIKKKAIFIR